MKCEICKIDLLPPNFAVDVGKCFYALKSASCPNCGILYLLDDIYIKPTDISDITNKCNFEVIREVRVPLG